LLLAALAVLVLGAAVPPEYCIQAICHGALEGPGNLKQQERMVALAGSPDRVIRGQDPLHFQKFPTVGRVAKIK
jgi:hypothetical protein